MFGFEEWDLLEQITVIERGDRECDINLSGDQSLSAPNELQQLKWSRDPPGSFVIYTLFTNSLPGPQQCSIIPLSMPLCNILTNQQYV